MHTQQVSKPRTLQVPITRSPATPQIIRNDKHIAVAQFASVSNPDGRPHKTTYYKSIRKVGCTCPGFRFTGNCDHCNAVVLLAHEIGWDKRRRKGAKLDPRDTVIYPSLEVA